MGKEFTASDPGGKLPARAKDMAPSKWAMLKKLFNEWLTEEEAEPAHTGDAEPPKGRASSVAFVTPEGRVLFLKRGDAEENYPATWAWPGGKADGDETPEACAARESREEIGDACPALDGMRMVDQKRTPFGWDHTTFTVPVKDEFEPKLNAEHSAFQWGHPDEAPTPLHPGVKATLDTLMAKVAEDVAALSTAANSGVPLGRRDGEDALTTEPNSGIPSAALTAPTHVLFGGKQMTREELLAAARKARLRGRGDIARRAEAMMAGFGAQATDMALDRALAADKRDMTLAMDRRTYSDDGHLHVDEANIAKASVNPYLGREIPDWEKLGLDPNRKYMLYRDAKELEKATPTFTNLPILSKHQPVSSDTHPSELVVGSTGEARWEAPFIKSSLGFWPKEAIDDIETKRKYQLSPAYRYRAIIENGIAPDGTPFQGRMVEIHGNHIATVIEGRQGDEIVVSDSLVNIHWAALERALLHLA